MRVGQIVAAVLTSIGCLLVPPTSALAQSSDACAFLCAPELKVEPTFTIEPLGRAPRIEVDGIVERPSRETVFELIFALEIPTEIPRVGLTLEAVFVPFGGTSQNPFTGTTAAALGRDEIRDNGIEIEVEVNFDLFDTDQTTGLVSSHVDVVDKFSPAKTPGAVSAYTHKLNFEWDTAFHVFKELADGHWLQNAEVELSLDYVATGLPKAGDVVGDERFLDDDNPWSLSFVLVFPLAPLFP